MLRMVQDNFSNKIIDAEIMLKANRMDLVDLFYREGKVKRVEYLEDGIKIELSLPLILYHKLLHNNEISNIN